MLFTSNPTYNETNRIKIFLEQLNHTDNTQTTSLPGGRQVEDKPVKSSHMEITSHMEILRQKLPILDSPPQSIWYT